MDWPVTKATKIIKEDIWPMEKYANARKTIREKITIIKKDRQVFVGPHLHFQFENHTTMWRQIHEMLYIEKGGEEQIQDELQAYNQLIPNGSNLVATLLIEESDEDKRKILLNRLGNIENAIYLAIGDDKINAISTDDQERTRSDGKTSSVHFLLFPLTKQHKSNFSSNRLQLIVDHKEYSHKTYLAPQTQLSLLKDLVL